MSDFISPMPDLPVAKKATGSQNVKSRPGKPDAISLPGTKSPFKPFETQKDVLNPIPMEGQASSDFTAVKFVTENPISRKRSAVKKNVPVDTQEPGNDLQLPVDATDVEPGKPLEVEPPVTAATTLSDDGIYSAPAPEGQNDDAPKLVPAPPPQVETPDADNEQDKDQTINSPVQPEAQPVKPSSAPANDAPAPPAAEDSVDMQAAKPASAASSPTLADSKQAGKDARLDPAEPALEGLYIPRSTKAALLKHRKALQEVELSRDDLSPVDSEAFMQNRQGQARQLIYANVLSNSERHNRIRTLEAHRKTFEDKAKAGGQIKTSDFEDYEKHTEAYRTETRAHLDSGEKLLDLALSPIRVQSSSKLSTRADKKPDMPIILDILAADDVAPSDKTPSKVKSDPSGVEDPELQDILSKTQQRRKTARDSFIKNITDVDGKMSQDPFSNKPTATLRKAAYQEQYAQDWFAPVGVKPQAAVSPYPKAADGFSEQTFDKVTATDLQLSGKNFKYARLINSNFSNNRITGTNFSAVTFQVTNLNGLNAQTTAPTQNKYFGAVFDGGSASGARFNEDDFGASDGFSTRFKDFTMTQAHVVNSAMTEVRASKSNFDGTTFASRDGGLMQMKLFNGQENSFKGAILDTVYAPGAKHEGSDFTGATVRNNDQSRGSLRNSIFDNAVLTGNDWTGADLRGTRLGNAKEFTDNILTGAVYDDKTSFPGISREKFPSETSYNQARGQFASANKMLHERQTQMMQLAMASQLEVGSLYEHFVRTTNPNKMGPITYSVDTLQNVAGSERGTDAVGQRFHPALKAASELNRLANAGYTPENQLAFDQHYTALFGKAPGMRETPSEKQVTAALDEIGKRKPGKALKELEDLRQKSIDDDSLLGQARNSLDKYYDNKTDWAQAVTAVPQIIAFAATTAATGGNVLAGAGVSAALGTAILGYEGKADTSQYSTGELGQMFAINFAAGVAGGGAGKAIGGILRVGEKATGSALQNLGGSVARQTGSEFLGRMATQTTRAALTRIPGGAAVGTASGAAADVTAGVLAGKDIKTVAADTINNAPTHAVNGAILAVSPVNKLAQQGTRLGNAARSWTQGASPLPTPSNEPPIKPVTNNPSASNDTAQPVESPRTSGTPDSGLSRLGFKIRGGDGASTDPNAPADGFLSPRPKSTVAPTNRLAKYFGDDSGGGKLSPGGPKSGPGESGELVMAGSGQLAGVGASTAGTSTVAPQKAITRVAPSVPAGKGNPVSPKASAKPMRARVTVEDPENLPDDGPAPMDPVTVTIPGKGGPVQPGLKPGMGETMPVKLPRFPNFDKPGFSERQVKPVEPGLKPDADLMPLRLDPKTGLPKRSLPDNAEISPTTSPEYWPSKAAPVPHKISAPLDPIAKPAPEITPPLPGRAITYPIMPPGLTPPKPDDQKEAPVAPDDKPLKTVPDLQASGVTPPEGETPSNASENRSPKQIPAWKGGTNKRDESLAVPKDTTPPTPLEAARQAETQANELAAKFADAGFLKRIGLKSRLTDAQQSLEVAKNQLGPLDQVTWTQEKAVNAETAHQKALDSWRTAAWQDVLVRRQPGDASLKPDASILDAASRAAVAGKNHEHAQTALQKVYNETGLGPKPVPPNLELQARLRGKAEPAGANDEPKSEAQWRDYYAAQLAARLPSAPAIADPSGQALKTAMAAPAPGMTVLTNGAQPIRRADDHPAQIPLADTRYAMQVVPNPDLLTEMDRFVRTHGGQYYLDNKTADTNVIYQPLSPLSSAQEQALTDRMRPYLRDNDNQRGLSLMDSTGQAQPGIRKQAPFSDPAIKPLLDRAQALDPALGEVLQPLGKEPFPSAAKVKAAEKLVAQAEQLSQAKPPLLSSQSNNLLGAGEIRPASELNPDTVTASLNKQLMAITPKQIEDVIARFPAAEQADAARALQRMSQFGTIDSLNEVHRALEKLNADGYVIKNLGAASLLDNMAYLAIKQDTAWTPAGESYIYQNYEDLQTLATQNAKVAFLLDEAGIRHLEKTPELVELLKSWPNAKLLNIAGWDNGINPFTPAHPSAMESKTSQVLASARQIQSRSSNPMSMDNAIQAALNLPSQERLRAAGVPQRLNTIENPQTADVPANAGQIAKQMAPAQLTPAQLQKTLDDFIARGEFPEAYRQAALEMLTRDSALFSPQRLASEAQAQHQRLLELAAHRGIPEKDIYYVIPSSGHSFSMMTMLHRIANNIPAEQIVEMPTEGNKLATQDLQALDKSSRKMFVILDDVAGSGSTLSMQYTTLRNQHPNDEIVIAPTVSSPAASKLFTDPAGLLPQAVGDKRFAYLPGQTAHDFRQTAYWQSLSPSQKGIFKQMMGNSGFADSGMNIAFPYMSPDNNNAFFGEFIAPGFLLNGRGNKSGKWHKFDLKSFPAVDSK